MQLAAGHHRTSKHEAIADSLRRESVSGKPVAGSLLPVQAELTRRFHVGSGTVTLALNRLSREGFVAARRRVGTVVCDRLPHLTRLAVVLPQKRTAGRWSNYYVAVTRVVEQQDGVWLPSDGSWFVVSQLKEK